MIASRTAARAARSARVVSRAPVRANFRHVRPESTSASASTQKTAAAAGGSSGVVGGLVGGAIVFAAGYGYYHMSG